MVRAEIKQASELRRKRYVPDSERTPDRDEMADWIESHIVEGDWNWSETTISEISETSGFSREHVARVLDAYFEPASGGQSEVRAQIAMAAVDQQASGDGFEDGFRQGFEAGIAFVLEHDELREDMS